MLIRDCTEMGFWPRGRGYAAAIKEIRGTNFCIRGNKKSTLSVLFAWVAEVCLKTRFFDGAVCVLDDG